MKAESKKKKKKALYLHRGTKITFTSDFLSETIQTRRKGSDLFKILKGKKSQPRTVYPAKISFKNKLRNEDIIRQTKPRISLPTDTHMSKKSV